MTLKTIIYYDEKLEKWIRIDYPEDSNGSIAIINNLKILDVKL